MLYFVSNRNGPRDVYASDVHTHVAGEAVRVTTGMNAHSIDISADGARMVYAAYTSTATCIACQSPAGRSSG